MKIETKIRIPKKYQAGLSEVYRDDDGIWGYCADGYYAAGMDGYDACHTIHEDNVADFMRQVRLIKSL